MVWNPFSGISGLLSSPTEEEGKQIDERYGIPRADVRQAQMGLLGNIGATLLAAGQRISPADRARLLAQVGPQTAQFSTDIYNAAQRRYQQGLLDEAKAKRLEEGKQRAQTQEERARLGAMLQPTYVSETEGGELKEVPTAYGQAQIIPQFMKAYPEEGARLFAELMTPPKPTAQSLGSVVTLVKGNQRKTVLSGSPEFVKLTQEEGFTEPEPNRAQSLGSVVTLVKGNQRKTVLSGSPEFVKLTQEEGFTEPENSARPLVSVLNDGTAVWTNPATGRQVTVPVGTSLTTAQMIELGMVNGGLLSPPASPPAPPSLLAPTVKAEDQFPTTPTNVTNPGATVGVATRPGVGFPSVVKMAWDSILGQVAGKEMAPDVTQARQTLDILQNNLKAFAADKNLSTQQQEWARELIDADKGLQAGLQNPASLSRRVSGVYDYALSQREALIKSWASEKSPAVKNQLNEQIQAFTQLINVFHDIANKQARTASGVTQVPPGVTITRPNETKTP